MSPHLKTIALISFSFCVGFLANETLIQKPTPLTDSQQITEPTPQVIEDYPECIAGLCPEYFSMDVDEDDQAESLIIIPTAMTQGAGKIWIIDEGKKIFESDEHMRIHAIQTREQIDASNGFTLSYGTKINSSEDGVAITYKYINGTFIQQ